MIERIDDVELNERVLTSGDGNVFPSDTLIGVVGQGLEEPTSSQAERKFPRSPIREGHSRVPRRGDRWAGRAYRRVLAIDSDGAAGCLRDFRQLSADAMKDWLQRIAIMAATLMLLAVALTPIGHAPSRYPPPDAIFCLLAAVIVRRPALVPAYVVVGLGLLCDILLFRPIGLWTLAMLGATEFLRGKVENIRGLPFIFEWMVVSAAFLGALAANYAVLTLFLTPQAELGLILMHYLATVIAYPVLVGTANVAFRIRKLHPVEEGGITGTRD